MVLIILIWLKLKDFTFKTDRLFQTSWVKLEAEKLSTVLKMILAPPKKNTLVKTTISRLKEEWLHLENP
jgi:hypothetical protein